MALVYADRVKEGSVTTGTGTYDLDGAATGFQGFVAAIGDTNTCFYCVTDGTDWEVGEGTVTDAATDTLSRDTISSSSNSGAAVNWGAGAKSIFVVLPAERISGNLTVDNFTDTTDYTSGTTTALTLSVTAGSETNIQVSFDGVTQHHDTYSLSG
ncbi:MAG: hypothetical protein KAS93_07910, partial [Gammaproteobacteria bacterium]|nr:hypothetical protein [Gammaproteobacteria bacterium]